MACKLDSAQEEVITEHPDLSSVDDSETNLEMTTEEVMQGVAAVNPNITLDDIKAEGLIDLQAIYKKACKIRILILGKTGVGKSTLVNGLLGRKVAEVKVGMETDGVTLEVTPYDTKIDDLDIIVYDSPGLQDGSGNDKKYLKKLHKACKDVDLVIFAIRMENRFVPGNPDIKAMVKFTQKFGSSVWNKTIVVITCSNLVEYLNPEIKDFEVSEKKEFFYELMGKYQAAVHQALVMEARVPPDIIKLVEVIPTGIVSEALLLDDKEWFSRFWFQCLKRVATFEGFACLIKASAKRFTLRNIADVKKNLKDRPILIPSLHASATATTVAIPAVFGGAIGAVGLIAGPAGAIAIPAGVLVGMLVGGIIVYAKRKSH